MRGERGRGSWRALVAALIDITGGKAELLSHAERPWASITFSGARHEVALRFTGIDAVAAGEALIAALPEHEFTLPGQVVVEARVVAADHRMLPEPCLTVTAELLLLDDA